MTRTSAQRAEFRRVATEFVNTVNADTFCAHCGAQPIEWHGEHHPEKPNARISSLRSQGLSIDRIQCEMDLCTPLCRSCHMKEDGRAAALLAARPRQPGSRFVPDKRSCSCCGREAKVLRNLRCSTCDNHHAGRRTHLAHSCDEAAE